MVQIPGIELLEPIGSGASGTVWKGLQLRENRRVAVKLIDIGHLDTRSPFDGELLERLRKEAAIIGQLNHPNIPDVYLSDEADGVLWIVQEFIPGTSVQQLLDQGHQFTFGEVRSLMNDLLCGLQYVHDKRIAHRDVKPSNLMRRPDGGFILIDFGTAKIIGTRFTQYAGFLGTPAYAAPEQLLDAPGEPEKWDIYAAGAFCYRLLSGRLPYPGTFEAIQSAQRAGQLPPPLPNTAPASRRIDEVLRGAMALVPAHRHETAEAFRQRLNVAMAGDANHDDTTVRIPRRRVRRTLRVPIPVRVPAPESGLQRVLRLVEDFLR